MSTDTQQGGFVGDPTEAFNPPATSGCCGGAFTPATDAPATDAPASVNSCCGTPEATAAGQCCTPTARNEAIDAGAGCCG